MSRSALLSEWQVQIGMDKIIEHSKFRKTADGEEECFSCLGTLGPIVFELPGEDLTHPQQKTISDIMGLVDPKHTMRCERNSLYVSSQGET